jgi:hypothetical protein
VAKIHQTAASGRPRPAGENFPRFTLLLGGERHKSKAGEAYTCLILQMMMTLKLKINMFREYL